MDIKTPIMIIVAISLISLTYVSLLLPGEADALPAEYPVYLSGGYAVELENETVYIDYLQPGSTENYLIHLFNDGMGLVRYRVRITDSPDEWLVFIDNGIQDTVVDMDSGSGKAIDLNIKTPVELTGEIDILVSDESSSDEWELTLRIICQRGPLVLSVPSDSYILGRETPSVFDVELKNIGSTILNVSLSFEGIATSSSRIEGAWTAIFSGRDLMISPGETSTVSVSVWCPQLEPKGSQKVSPLEASVQGINRPFSTGSISFRVQTIFDIRSSVRPMGYIDVLPGGQAEFTISIENWADDYDTATVDLFEKPSGWDVVFNDTIDPTTIPITVNPEGEREFHPIVMVPRNAIAGESVVQLIVEGTTNTTMIHLRVRVGRKDLFSLSSVTSSGSEETYRITIGENLLPFQLRNMGNFYDTVTLSIETIPSWAALSFHSVLIGSRSDTSTVSALSGVNISGERDKEIFFLEEDITTISISSSPGQTSILYLKTDISPSATSQSGVVGIKYSYGIFQEQRFLQASLKLILADIEIVDLDGDGISDLEVTPKGDLEIGDKINFNWSLRNNYPYETSGLTWTIELSGQVLLSGDVGSIGPGETVSFSETWRSDKSTKLRNRAILRIKGDVFPSEEKQPSAMSGNDIYISPGKGTPPWGYMVLFGGIMLLLIGGFVAFFLWVRKDLEEKEAKERERYESLYGRKERPTLKGDIRPGKRANLLDKGARPGLPESSPIEVKEKGKGSKEETKRTTIGSGKKKKAVSLDGLVTEDPKGKKRFGPKKDSSSGKTDMVGKNKKRTGKKKRERPRSVDDEEELEELEEI